MFNLTFPAFLFGSLFASAYGAAFHLWRNGGWRKMFFYLLVSFIGFWVGHTVGALLDVTFWSIGPVVFSTATGGSLLFLMVGHWLSLVGD
jgi:hypothetical protein